MKDVMHISEAIRSSVIKIPESAWELVTRPTLEGVEPCSKCGTRKRMMLRRNIPATEGGTVTVWICPVCWERAAA